MLTRKQHELLAMIESYTTEKGYSPSFDEMKDALSLKSKSNIHRLITNLEDRGFLRRLPNRSRALEVIPKHTDTIFTTKIEDRRITNIPIMGTIAAGSPIEAIQDHISDFPAPSSMVGKSDCFALIIKGDSMMEAGILDGDTVVIKRTSSADNGDIVVALVDNETATLKKYKRHNETIELVPCNSNYETNSYNPDQVKIQGRIIGLVRSY